MIRGPLVGQADVCEPVLRALPDWFGIEEANLHYLAEIEKLPTFLAITDETAVGFLTIQIHFPQTAEIIVMGVLPDQHRQGHGRAMLTAAEAWLQTQEVQFLQVKTLSSRHPDPYYARTRNFYTSVGFVPLEEFPTLWGEANPCLQLIKSLL